MKSIFKRKSYIELPSFSSVTNEDVIFHIGAPKTGSTAIQKFCLENRETLKEHGLYYPYHGVDVSDLKSALYAVFGTFQGNNASNFSTVVASAILSSTYLM